MGYTTDFSGRFEFDTPLTIAQSVELSSFADTRHNESDYPGCWCQWVPSQDGNAVVWDGCEKFYNYISWLEYLISNYFEKWGKKLNGEVTWQGEDDKDFGKIIVTDNVVSTKKGRKVYE